MAIPVPTYRPAVEPPDPRKRIQIYGLIGLAVFLAWQALSLRSYIQKDTRPPSWDQAIHMEIALDYRQALAQGRLSDAFSLRPKPGMPPFPPAYHLALTKAYDSDNPAGAALWLNWFYFALLGVALFAIAFHFRPDYTALPCTVLFLCAPGVQELLHTQLIDLSVVAFVAAAYWALIVSEEFLHWGWSLVFGLAFGAGMLHKWTAFSYLLPAFYVALKALEDKNRRWQAVSAMALGVVLFAPWYWHHMVVLVPRLFQASSDFSVPVWKGGAFFHYFLQMSEALGPVFWALSFIGLLVPQYTRAGGRGWLLAAWFMASYVFWAIVPNRQMRFLMPALPALAVAGMGAWPPFLIWGMAALQLFTAANFANGWISKIVVPTPFQPLTFFPTDPAAKEDWKLEDILREAQKRHRAADFPVADLTLVANDTRFNAPTFVWTAKRLGLTGVNLRGVNSRLCELSEFVLAKTGSLGPPGVISQLPEAAKEIGDRRGWFLKAYEAVGEWPLPDGSKAILYQQIRREVPALPLTHYDFQYYEVGSFTAENLKLDLGAWDPAQAAYKNAVITASHAVLRGVPLGSVRVEFEGLTFVTVPDKELPGGAWQDVRFLRIGKLRLASVQLDTPAIAAYIQSQAKGLTLKTFTLEGGTIQAAGNYKALAVSGEAAVKLTPEALVVELLRAQVGPFNAPPSLLGGLSRYTLPFTPTPEFPFRLELPGLTMKGDRVTVP